MTFQISPAPYKYNVPSTCRTLLDILKPTLEELIIFSSVMTRAVYRLLCVFSLPFCFKIIVRLVVWRAGVPSESQILDHQWHFRMNSGYCFQILTPCLSLEILGSFHSRVAPTT